MSLINLPKNIIVKMPNWFGDVVMATPILADLRHKFPQAKITVMSQSNISPLLRENPYIDEFYSYKKPSGWIHRSDHWAIIDTLRLGDYDLGILLTNSFSSAWWFWRGDVNYRIGYAGNLRSFLLNEAIGLPKNVETQHLVLTYKELLLSLGIPISNTPPSLYISEEERNAADLLLGIADRPNSKIVGINPGAAYGSAKCWLPDRFQGVTEKLLQDPDVIVVYFGDQGGASLVEQICAEFPVRVINLAGKTNIRELMALIKRCDAFLTNDSGPMHIAAALGTPLVALFGSTNPTKTGPYGSGPIKVICKNVDCAPCYKRVCPVDFRCMKKIEVDEVYGAIVEVMQEGKEEGKKRG